MSPTIRLPVVLGAAGLAAAAVLAHLRLPQIPLWPLLMASVALVCWATGWVGGLAAAAAASALVALAGYTIGPGAGRGHWVQWVATAAGFAAAACAVCLGAGAARRSRELHDRAIQALVAAIDARFAWSEGRSERVARYAAAIGRRLGVRGRRAQHLRLGALLHDVGALLVSPEVLSKKGVLSAPQRMEIEVHPQRGVNLLELIGYDQEVLDAVRYHHERADGTGYPSGLVGAQTPLLAKIVAVADAFEALTQERPHRPAMTAAEAVEILRGGAYWPHVVDALTAALESGDIAMPRAGPEAAQRRA